MDHFPPILKPFDPVVVPYYGGEYDNGDFVSFAARKKIDIEALQTTTSISGAARDEAAAFLQAWLFFGLIQQTLQLSLETSDFVCKTGNGKRRVTTDELKFYMKRWKLEHDEAKIDIVKLDERKAKTIETLNHAYDVWRGFEDFAGIVGGEVELSIQLLGNALQHAVTTVSSKLKESDYQPWVETAEVPWDLHAKNAFLAKRMSDQGWCPSIIASPVTHMNISFKYYLSLYGPPRVKNHREAGCKNTDQSCRATSVKLAGYKTRHVEADCQCEFLEPDMTEVCRIINEGEIPILFLSGANDSKRLEVVQHRNELQYTALSHVWADGLGNRECNSLPRCQFERVVGYMQKMPWTKAQVGPLNEYDDRAWKTIEPIKGPWYMPDDLKRLPMYFWVDTICVPLEGVGPEGTQALAIEKMRSVYSRANRVLVLDADLVSTQVAPVTELGELRPDIHARMTGSNWQRRCWTLQEGVLAKKLWFQFANELFCKMRPGDQYGNQAELFFDDVVAYRCDDTSYEWWVDAETTTATMKVCRVWQALKHRSTSVPEDVPLCVAILLDMTEKQIRELLQVQPKQRVRKLWSMHTVIPAGILFSPTQRLDDPEFCWAPSSISDCALVGPPVSYPANVESGGKVSVVLHGFVVDLPTRHNPQSVIAIEAEDGIYYIRQNLNRNNKPWQGIDFSKIQRLGIILGQEVPSLEPIRSPIPRPSLSACLAAMVSVVGQDEKGFIVNYLRAVSVIKKGSLFDKHANLSRPWSKIEVAEKEKVIKASLVPTNQHWLITPKQQ